MENTNLKSTKFILTCAVLVMAYGLVIMGKLDAKEWFQFATIGIGLYSASNVLQKFS